MSTSLPKRSRKSARRASGARDAALAAVAAAFFAACSGGVGDAGIGLPPGQGPINWGAVQTLATDANAVTAPATTIDGNGLASVLWSQIGMPLPGGGVSQLSNQYSAFSLMDDSSTTVWASGPEPEVEITLPLARNSSVSQINLTWNCQFTNVGRLGPAAGFGVGYRSPIGPIRVDLGFNLDRRELVPGTLDEKELDRIT